jgi:hypothetical protein
MRVQDVEGVGEQGADEVGGVGNHVDIEPEHPRLVSERPHEELVAAAGER